MATDARSDSEDLDSLVRRVDPDRWRSSRFITDPGERADVITLYAYDHELARAPKVASNSLLGEIRLTWWREALDEIFEGRPVRRHPTAQALAGAVARRGLPRESLEAMIDARYRELDPAPMSEPDSLEWARDTGGGVAELALRVLDPEGDAIAAASGGAAWSLAWRAAVQPELRPTFVRELAAARTATRRLSAQGFPAVAHAALAAGRARGAQPSALESGLRLTLAVARGRI